MSIANGVAGVIQHTAPFGVPQGVPPNWNNGDTAPEMSVAKIVRASAAAALLESRREGFP